MIGITDFFMSLTTRPQSRGLFYPFQSVQKEKEVTPFLYVEISGCSIRPILSRSGVNTVWTVKSRFRKDVVPFSTPFCGLFGNRDTDKNPWFPGVGRPEGPTGWGHAFRTTGNRGFSSVSRLPNRMILPCVTPLPVGRLSNFLWFT